jgi:hypothetical protein
MHLPSSWGNPDKADDVAAWLSGEAGGNVTGGVGRVRDVDGDNCVGARVIVLEKSTLEGFIVVFLLDITLVVS